MSTMSLIERAAGRPLVRRLTDAVMARYAARRVAQLDHQGPRALQRQTLSKLVHAARNTRFGRDHSFDKIRSITDYQVRVPLGDYEAFWQRYWGPAFPNLDNVTWPGKIPYFALTSGTTAGATKYIPISRQMLASNQKAALTTLSLFLTANPGAKLFDGRMFFLGGSTDLEVLGGPGGPLGGDLSGIVAREASSLLRPFTYPPLDLALVRDWEAKMTRFAEESAQLPITAVSGVPSWLLVLFERLRQVTGKTCLADIWPGLRLVIHGGTKFDPYRPLFEKVIGNPAVRFLETYPASEGFIATEDPRFDHLRLIPDHQVFFEFVPVEDLHAERPARHTVATLEPGVQYAVALTTCAGLWSYLLGDTVCFEKRNPPLLRFTGRTKYFLSAFGEHLISEEVEKAIAVAASATASAVVDFHVGPRFPETTGLPGRHCYLVEFLEAPADLGRFAKELDDHLCRNNEDYRAHRAGDLTMLAPEVHLVRRGGFTDWMRSVGKLGGQHKVPRMDNSGVVTEAMARFFFPSSKVS